MVQRLILGRLLVAEELRQRANGGMYAGRVERRDGQTLRVGVDDGPVLDAPVPAVGEDLEDVSDVDDEGALPRRDGKPSAVTGPPDLQALDLVDLEDQGEEVRVGVRGEAQDLVRRFSAGRVVVHPHRLHHPAAAGDEALRVREVQVPGHGAQQAVGDVLDGGGVGVQRPAEAVGPEAEVPVLRRLRVEVEDVGPVQLLVVGDDEQLAVALQLTCLLTELLLGLRRKREECLGAGLHRLHHILRNTVVYQLFIYLFFFATRSSRYISQLLFYI